MGVKPLTCVLLVLVTGHNPTLECPHCKDVLDPEICVTNYSHCHRDHDICHLTTNGTHFSSRCGYSASASTTPTTPTTTTTTPTPPSPQCQQHNIHPQYYTHINYYTFIYCNIYNYYTCNYCNIYNYYPYNYCFTYTNTNNCNIYNYYTCNYCNIYNYYPYNYCFTYTNTNNNCNIYNYYTPNCSTSTTITPTTTASSTATTATTTSSTCSTPTKPSSTSTSTTTPASTATSTTTTPTSTATPTAVPTTPPSTTSPSTSTIPTSTTSTPTSTATPTTPPSTAHTTTTTLATTPAVHRTCYQCGSVDDGTYCTLQDIYIPHASSCPAGTSFCMTDIEQHVDGTTNYIKRCVDQNQCQKLWYEQTSDISECVDMDPTTLMSAMTCRYCCTTDNCNGGKIPAKETLYNPKN
ncbi:integumentary mucin C.1-like [Haliotis rubra]|uniref:integumentary mucin C.1-like n=1 Tax=Haliotis rubra TaxID=36100 RepID=UPI001EE5EC9B|nr:integumentary mucin C.1-like [Haliotis rubra]